MNRYNKSLRQIYVSAVCLLGCLVWVASTWFMLYDSMPTPIPGETDDQECVRLMAGADQPNYNTSAFCDVGNTVTDRSIIPVVGMVMLGIALTATLLSALRFRGVRSLKKDPVDKHIAMKVLRQRLLIHEVYTYTDTTCCSRVKPFEQPERRDCRSATDLDTEENARESQQGGGGGGGVGGSS